MTWTPRCGCSRGVPTRSLGAKELAIQPCTPSRTAFLYRAMITGIVKAEVDESGYTYLKRELTSALPASTVPFSIGEATVDTGFTGGLALPEETIETLGLTLYGRRPPAMSTAWVCLKSTAHWCLGMVSTDSVGVQTRGEPLVGMALLEGSQLTVVVREDGAVIIEELPGSEWAAVPRSGNAVNHRSNAMSGYAKRTSISPRSSGLCLSTRRPWRRCSG